VASPIVSTGSGALDVTAIVDALMKIERRPLDKLDAREKTQNSKISAYGTIKSLFASLQTAAAALGSSSSSKFSAFKVTSSDTTEITATADSTASAATYTVNVTNLAKAQNLVASGQASKTAAISDGTATTITVDFGTISGTLTNGIYDPGATFTSNGSGTHDIVIDGTNNTLEGIRDAINAADIGVTASIVNDGSGTPYRLVLSSDNSGAANSIKITTSGGDGTIASLLGYDPEGTQNLTQTVEAKNAVFDVNGISISKASNSVTDAIDGVTLNLLKEPVSSASLTVARDTAAVTEAVAAFVKAYNDLYTGMKGASAFKSGSSLEGDSTLRSLQMQLRELANGTVTGGTMSKLYEVGITFTSDGKMQLNSATLSSALASDFDDVVNLFSAADGFATLFEDFASDSSIVGGTIDSRISTILDDIARIGSERLSLESRLKSIEQRYRMEFSNLNVLLGSMNQTSNYLAQQAQMQQSQN
jgi:flagellar hook-associated protein 2